MKPRVRKGLLFLWLTLTWIRPAVAGVPEKVWETRVLKPAPQGYPSRIVRNVRALADGSLMALGPDGAAASALRYSASGQTLSTVTLQAGRGGPGAIDAFGNFVITTPFDRSAGFSVMRFDGTTGATLWAKIFVVDAPVAGFADPEAVVLDPRGDVLIAARSGTPNAFFAAVYKLDGVTGSLLWGPSLLAESSGSDPILLRTDGAGRIFLAMTQDDPVTYRKLAVTQLDPSTGVIRWGPVTLGRTFTDSLVDAAVDGNGDVVVTGKYGGITATLKVGGSSGALLWGPILETAAAPKGVVCDARGEVVVAIEATPSSPQTLLVGYDGSSGERRWGPVLFPAAYASDAKLRVDATGNAFVSAKIPRPGLYPTDIGTAAFDVNTGARLWGPVEMGGPDNSYDELGALELDLAGAVVVAGSVNSGAAMIVHAYDRATGTTLWGPRYFWGGGNGSDIPSSSDTDAAGDIFVAADHSWDGDSLVTKVEGRSGRILWGPVPLGLPNAGVTKPKVHGTTPGDAVVARWNGRGSSVVMLNGLNGTLRWTRSFAGVAFPLAVPGPGGDVLFAGLASGTNLMIWKLAGSTGATLWGPANLGAILGIPEDGTVDANGDLVLAGEIGRSMAVVKIGGASGSLVWGPTVVTSGGNSIDHAVKVLIDASANVLVSGTNSEGPASFQTVTKLRGTTGVPLWGPWTSAASGFFGGNSDMALDASGNVVVTGGGTFRLDANTGAAVWASSTVAQFVQFGGDGNVVLAASSFDDSLFDWALTFQKLDSATGLPLWAPLHRPHASSLAALANVEGDPVFVAATTDLEKATLLGRYSDGLTISPATSSPGAVLCGRPFSFSFHADNGTPPIQWNLLSGTLPSGLTLGSDGTLSGTTSDVGEFPVIVRITDGTGRTTTREVTVRVLAAAAVAAIHVATSPACQGPDRVLSVIGSYDAYEWLPGGETTPSIIVRPVERTTYGVTVRTGSCLANGAVILEPGPMLLTPTIAAPERALAGSPGLTASATERPGSTYFWSISNGTIESGQGTSRIQFTAGVSGPLSLSVSETDAAGCLHPEASRRVMVVSSAAGLLFYAVPPCRLLDTRLPSPNPVTLRLDFGYGVFLAGSCGIPFAAQSVVINVTVTAPTAAGDLRIAAGRPSAPPDVSLLSFQPGQTRAVSTLVSLPSDGSNLVTLWGAGSPTVHVVLDVSGYFQ
ncbi:MAG TPA: putative Ig domain-containing protein [Thermoanaerobaculia bacterium]|nr:putative Ig domain-containing protein [Thermoanaerobaculia bacterium]